MVYKRGKASKSPLPIGKCMINESFILCASTDELPKPTPCTLCMLTAVDAPPVPLICDCINNEVFNYRARLMESVFDMFYFHYYCYSIYNLYRY